MPKQNPYKNAEYAKPVKKEENKTNSSVSDDISQILASLKDQTPVDENTENTLDTEKLKGEIAKIDAELANLNKKSKQKGEQKADKELSD